MGEGGIYTPGVDIRAEHATVCRQVQLQTVRERVTSWSQQWHAATSSTGQWPQSPAMRARNLRITSFSSRSLLSGGRGSLSHVTYGEGYHAHWRTSPGHSSVCLPLSPFLSCGTHTHRPHTSTAEREVWPPSYQTTSTCAVRGCHRLGGLVPGSAGASARAMHCSCLEVVGWITVRLCGTRNGRLRQTNSRTAP